MRWTVAVENEVESLESYIMKLTLPGESGSESSGNQAIARPVALRLPIHLVIGHHEGRRSDFIGLLNREYSRHPQLIYRLVWTTGETVGIFVCPNPS